MFHWIAAKAWVGLCHKVSVPRAAVTALEELKRTVEARCYPQDVHSDLGDAIEARYVACQRTGDLRRQEAMARDIDLLLARAG
jgi:hypothetical protein